MISGYVDPLSVLGIHLGNNAITLCEGHSGFMPYILVHTQSFNDWNHFAIVQDNNNISLYIDGTFIKIAQETGFDRVFDYDRIGRVYDTGTPYAGTLDNLKIFDRALSPEQIQLLYNNRSDLIVNNETSI